ncbi:hypothetical protein cyc_03630 [Cyclospora cayetanensis]|uniref:Uncharacterized protein n=1 Tax=Cyclospora cayetanensis TaxID=88456 RepID=A0A1D3D9Q6_9EIME|nr:hypothetical protein cyc_03630 [Cyclospora cayetanensis]
MRGVAGKVSTESNASQSGDDGKRGEDRGNTALLKGCSDSGCFRSQRVWSLRCCMRSEHPGAIAAWRFASSRSRQKSTAAPTASRGPRQLELVPSATEDSFEEPFSLEIAASVAKNVYQSVLKLPQTYAAVMEESADGKVSVPVGGDCVDRR